MPVKETELAWLAGLIDGEGCIRIGRDTRRFRTVQYFMLVEITQKGQIRELKAVG